MALIDNLISYYKLDTVAKAMPELLVACKSANYQVRAIALYTLGKLSLRMKLVNYTGEQKLSMFDTVFELLSDNKPLVRK